MGKIIGIDLGTTNTCLAVVEGDSVQIIPNAVGGRTTPSIIGFTDKGDRLIGQIAKRQAITNARNTVFAVKRLMGRKFDSDEIRRIKSLLPYEIADCEGGDVRVKIRDKSYSPPELSAILLQNLKNAAEEFLGEKVAEAVITVPAYFDDSQRQATKDAGKIAGLDVKRIVNEPTAAALAYGHGQAKAEKLVIYDLGGGTFDVSVLELNEGIYEVLATCGDSFLGGEDFDHKIMQWLIEEFRNDTGIDLSKDVLALQRLKETAEKAKCELSTAMETHINLPFISADDRGPKHLDKVLSRSKFEQLVKDLIDDTVEPCMNALADAKLNMTDIDKIILVGGQSRTPAVRERVAEIFGRTPVSEINPDEVVAIGAAIQGGVLKGDVKDIVLLDVIPLTLGVETHGGLFTKLIPRNSSIPLKKTTVFTTVADNQSTVEVHILQGEREIAKHNRSLARFELVGIAAAPRGIPQIEVTFDIDVNGIVHVSARDQKSLKEQAIKITPSSGLAKEEIEAMVRDAQLYLESDQKERELTQTRNRIDDLASSVRNSYKEFGWMLDGMKQERIKTALDTARMATAEDAEKLDLTELNVVLASLEASAESLRRAIFSMTEGEKGSESIEGAGKDDTAQERFEPDSTEDNHKLPAR